MRRWVGSEADVAEVGQRETEVFAVTPRSQAEDGTGDAAEGSDGDPLAVVRRERRSFSLRRASRFCGQLDEVEARVRQPTPILDRHRYRFVILGVALLVPLLPFGLDPVVVRGARDSGSTFDEGFSGGDCGGPVDDAVGLGRVLVTDYDVGSGVGRIK